ncbi:MAG: RecX family transcriptional regulator [Bacilli bacterium]|nr:RecX family transcriptional regulator [Bacilli bacterium]
MKFNLLLEKEIKDLDLVLAYNEKFSLYDKVLGYISKKNRTELEVRNYLKKYTSSLEEIDNIINKLYENNILNKENYIRSYINDKIYLSLDGPNKIKNDLINLGFDSYLIEDELVIFTKELIVERINK